MALTNYLECLIKWRLRNKKIIYMLALLMSVLLVSCGPVLTTTTTFEVASRTTIEVETTTVEVTSGTTIEAETTTALHASTTTTSVVPTVTINSSKTHSEPLTEDELETLLSELPLAVISTEYIVQNDSHKVLYPDMLQATVKNNSAEDIKDVVLAFVAWDSNNLPVKIKGQFDFSGGSFITKVSMTEANIIPGETALERKGYPLDENNKVDTFKAIVFSYKTFEGTEWKNPYFEDFRNLYEEKKLIT